MRSPNLAPVSLFPVSPLVFSAVPWRKRRGPLADWLIVGLGNPGPRYARTRHNVGFMVCQRLIEQYDLGKPKQKYRARIAEGRLGPGGPGVFVLMPETFMNEAGKAVGPARGELHLDADRVVVVHDEIDFSLGRVESRLGGGTGGHNGLKSVRQALGTTDFWRVRIGIGRPDSTDPEIVSRYVLGTFDEPLAEVDALIADGLRETLNVVAA